MKVDDISRNKYIAGLLSLFLSASLTAILLFFISKNCTFSTNVTEARNILAVGYADLIKPEPMERALFLTGIFIMPVLLLLLYKFFFDLTSHFSYLNILNKLYNTLYLGLIFLIFFLGYVGIKKNISVYSLNSHYIGINSISLIVLGIAALLFYFKLINSAITKEKDLLTRTIEYALYFLSLLLIFSISLLCIFSINSVDNTFKYTMHFNAIFHAMVQVYMGKELLVDLTHQYGLYPHFIEPIFKLFGLSVLGYTILMGILMGLSFFFIFKFLREITSNRIIGYLGFIVMTYYGYLFGQVAGGFDHYFQYFPIRFFFPTLSVLLTYKYLKNSTQRLYYASFVIYSIAVLWNFDTGFVVFASWLLVLLFRELFTFDFKKMLYHIFTGMLVFFGIFMLFTFYTYIRYGALPKYFHFFSSQKIFYLYGFCMLPMPILHPWNLVLFVYAAGLLYSFSFLVEKKESVKAETVFFLSILGVGAFSYYQGRSHDLTFLVVCYPAIIIITILTDSLLQHIKCGGGNNDKLAFGAILFFMIYSVASLAENYSAILRTINTQLSYLKPEKPGDIAKNSDFIASNARKSERVFILSGHSGIYYLALGAGSPLKLPGLAELHLAEDVQKLRTYLTDSNLIDKIIIDRALFESFSNYLDTKYLYANFDISINPNGQLIIFVRKKQ